MTEALRTSRAKGLTRLPFFKNTYSYVVMKVINNLNVAKSYQMNNIPTKIIKMNKDIFANFITDHPNYCIVYSEFRDELKHAVNNKVQKKNEKCEKTNYRPVSILTNLSKIYKKLMYNQLSQYFGSLLLATNQCGSRKVSVRSAVC